MDLIGARRHLMTSPLVSRKDVRGALEFAANNGVRPLIAPRPLEEAGDVLDEMHEGCLRNRVVLTME